MERYEAILEQLKNAQSRGMETISNRLDFVVQSLEELIQEAKSSVQEALPRSAAECFPVEEVEETLQAFHDEAESERQRASELEARIGELESEVEDTTQGMSIELLRSLDGARSQSELLKELLPAISGHAARAVVLVLRDGRASAWSGIGFADGEHLRAWQGEISESPALGSLLDASRPIGFAPAEDELFAGWLTDEETPDEILLIPVVLRAKLMGAVYVDRIEGHPWDPDTAQTLVAQVCWLIDTLQFRSAEAPTLAEPVGIDPAIAVSPAEEPTTEVVTTEVEPEAVADQAPADEGDEEEEPAAEAVAAAEEPAEMEEDPSATMKIDVSEVGFTDPPPEDDIITEAVTEPEAEIAGESFEPDGPAELEADVETEGESFEPDEPSPPEFEVAPEEADEEPAPEEETAEAAPIAPETVPTEVQLPVTPPEEPEEVEEPEEEPESSGSQFLDEPPPVQPVQPPPDEPEEEMSDDEAQQEEARRFARLLVSEIKLYNEEQVERGRENKDLYTRLREDIDRSREMFEKRISEEVRAKQDYFQDELVRILADGDPDVFGA